MSESARINSSKSLRRWELVTTLPLRACNLLANKAPECTPKAVTHRISKFRNAKESSGDATPESKATKATKNGSTAKKRGKKAAGEGEDDAEESPSKKIKVKEDEADGEETGADVDEKSEGEVSA